MERKYNLRPVPYGQLLRELARRLDEIEDIELRLANAVGKIRREQDHKIRRLERAVLDLARRQKGKK